MLLKKKKNNQKVQSDPFNSHKKDVTHHSLNLCHQIPYPNKLNIEIVQNKKLLKNKGPN